MLRNLALDLLPPLLLCVPGKQLEIVTQKLDDKMIGNARTMRDCRRLNHQAIGWPCLLELVQQARLAYARLADYGDDLATTDASQFERAPNLLDFVLAPDKLRKSTLNRNLKVTLKRARPRHLIGIHGG